MAMKWQRCSKQRRSRNVENVKGEGVELKDGSVTPTLRKDGLAARAAEEMERWRKTLPKKQCARIPSVHKGDRTRKATKSTQWRDFG